LVYPAVVVSIAVIVIAVIMIFVIPVFQDLFASVGRALPLPTQIVVDMSDFTKGNIHYMIGGFIILYGFLGGIIGQNQEERKLISLC